MPSFAPVFTTSRTGKRYQKGYTDQSTGEYLSNRKYQQQYGSVAKSGFTTIEQKQKALNYKQTSNKLAKTTNREFDLGYVDESLLPLAIKTVLAKNKSYWGMFLIVEVTEEFERLSEKHKGTKSGEFATRVRGTMDASAIQDMIDEANLYLDRYGLSDVYISGYRLVLIGDL